MQTQRTHYYFAYGSNTHVPQMRQRCPGAINLGLATLPEYRLCFRGHADIELNLDYQVQGVLWEITDTDLDALDRYEGFPAYYLRHRVFVETDQGICAAWVYTMAEQEYVSSPTSVYLDVCREGYHQNGIDQAQIDEALPAKNINFNYVEDYYETFV
jgi:gamma-glutamylcyclotransferase (GGCT)/AIG2-like uncharacterized protein YtfP